MIKMANKLNILFVGCTHYPDNSGAVRRMIPLFREISKKGHKVFMIEDFNGAENRLLGRDKTAGNMQVQWIGSRWLWSKGGIFKVLSELIIPFHVFFSARKNIKKFNPDLIHAFNPNISGGIAGWMLAKFHAKPRRLPLALEMNDLVAQLGIMSGWTKEKSLKGRVYLFLQDNFPKLADVIITTPYIKKHLMKKSGIDADKIEIIQCGADTKKFDPAKISPEEISKIKHGLGLKDEKIILYCGSFNLEFGAENILKIIPAIAKKYDNFKLVVVGPVAEDQKNKIEGMIKKLKISRYVIFAGRHPYDEMPRFISIADVCVNPFPATELCRSGSPIKVFEYMAMEKPVVHPDLESMEDVIIDGENGFLYNADNPEEMADKILYLFNDPSAAEEIGRKAREAIIKKYTWKALAEKMEVAYYKVLR